MGTGYVLVSLRAYAWCGTGYVLVSLRAYALMPLGYFACAQYAQPRAYFACAQYGALAALFSEAKKYVCPNGVNSVKWRGGRIFVRCDLGVLWPISW